jgi:hypothetical protein
MNYRGLTIVAWFLRILALVVALGTPVLVLLGIRTAEIYARLMAERGIVAEPYNPLLSLGAGLLIALALYTFGALLALLVDMAIAQRETADLLAAMRRRQ